uniref:Glycosyltransferase n=1 Tax=Lactococcus lactis TaxID=1358 RepID=A0A451F0D3_9LACT|nr:glycosyltransferase [Lactococcus lactis]
MIPKIIHYCWFGGGELPELDRKCIESWKKYCPDYEIIEWNEKNYDVTQNRYMHEAYKAHKLGFVPDYARFDIVYQNGGIYMDTDVELVKPLDELLALSGYMGLENGNWVNGGMGFGAEKGNEVMKLLRDMYDDKTFYNTDGTMNLTPSPYYITDLLVSLGLKRENTEQAVKGITIFPTDVLSPKDYETGKIKCTNRTFSIHHYNGSWFGPWKRVKRKIIQVIGLKNFKRIARLKKIGKK